MSENPRISRSENPLVAARLECKQRIGLCKSDESHTWTRDPAYGGVSVAAEPASKRPLEIALFITYSS